VSAPQPTETDTANAPADQAPPKTPGARMLLTLGGISMLAGFLVVLAYQFTAPIIAENQRVAIEKAVFRVVPGATSQRAFLVDDSGARPVNDSEPDNGAERVYAGYDDQGQLKGIALKTEATGYQDVIRILYGYDPACQCITGIKVLKMAETPGLGDRIASDPGFLANFQHLDGALDAAGTALAHAIETVKHGHKTQPWQIDAISGATISSTAVGRMLDKSGQRMFPLIQRYLSAFKAGG
jgi:Na+-translocating ferredoxin:NAD+ oxidoreductase subunit G